MASVQRLSDLHIFKVAESISDVLPILSYIHNTVVEQSAKWPLSDSVIDHSQLKNMAFTYTRQLLKMLFLYNMVGCPTSHCACGSTLSVDHALKEEIPINVPRNLTAELLTELSYDVEAPLSN